MIKPTDDNTKIAIIQTDITYIKKDISDIKTVLKDGYATKDSLLEVAKETERRLTNLEQATTFWKWISPIIASVLSAFVTFLVIQYLMKN